MEAWSEVGANPAHPHDFHDVIHTTDAIHCYSFRFGARGRDALPDAAILHREDPQSFHTRKEWPKLKMSILDALLTQITKSCTVFSDKLAILGNLTDYPYRLHPSEAFQKQLSFSACALAMALFNGDLSPLFRGDSEFLEYDDKTEFLEYDDETDIPHSLLPSQSSLYAVAYGRPVYSRSQVQIMAGSKCLVLGGKLLVEGILWKIVPFTGLEGLEKTTEPIAKEGARDPIRFYFFQALVRRLIALGRIDLLELVVVSVMRRQLTSPLELVHLLNQLQAWSCNEQHWPMSIAEDSFLKRSPVSRNNIVHYRDGRTRKVVELLTCPDAGSDMAMCVLESDDSQPKDLLSHIYHAVQDGRPLALGECKVGDQTLVSLFTFDPPQHQWVLTPVNELEYEFGKNPWLHLELKNKFWCVKKSEHTVSVPDLQRASEILNLGEEKKKYFSDETFKVVTSGKRSSITGTWSSRLSRRGVLTIRDDGSWNITPLRQGTYSI